MSKLKKLYWSQAGMETRTNTPQGVMHFYRGLEADAEIARLRETISRLTIAGKALYFAGRWRCDREVDEAALWEALRDALGLPPGTATRAGVEGKP